MVSKSKPPRIPLPKSWGKHVRSAVVHIIALAQDALTYSRSWAADSTNQRVRLKADNDRLEQEVALFREEIHIKDARMGKLDPKRRPHYAPSECRASWRPIRAAACRGFLSARLRLERHLLANAQTIALMLSDHLRSRLYRPPVLPGPANLP
jgi:hypothetical protein